MADAQEQALAYGLALVYRESQDQALKDFPEVDPDSAAVITEAEDGSFSVTPGPLAGPGWAGVRFIVTVRRAPSTAFGEE